MPSRSEKYTNLCATPGVGQLAQREMAPFDRKPCMCETAHAKQAVGKDAAAAATYPVRMNIALAKAIVRIVKKRIEGGKTGDLALAINLQRRTEALVEVHTQATRCCHRGARHRGLF